MKKELKISVLILLSIILVKAKAENIDSLPSKTNNISIEFAGGVTYSNYTFKKIYDYGGDNLTIPDSLTNAIGKSFELRVQLPIKKSKFSIVLGAGFTERNLNYTVNEAYSKQYEPHLRGEYYTNNYLGLIIGLRYKIINTSHYALDANVDIMPSYQIREKDVLYFYENYKPNQTFINSNNYIGSIPTKKLITPIGLKINNSYKVNQHFSVGLSLGLFYDSISPYPDNITKNKLNYSSNIILKYTL